jgi:isocitrate dehydrogenase (NAD+)
MFEAVHGSAPSIAGQNKANPIALLLGSLMMLEHIDEARIAHNIRLAIYKALADKSVCTPDIGGNGSTESFTKAVCDNLG